MLNNIQYDLKSQHRLIQTLKSRPPLSPSDLAAKKKIAALEPAGSEIIYQSPDFTIYYVSSADFFQAEILTTDVTKAKQKAVNWFKSEGMSQQGICDLPIGFYLNYSISQQLQNSNVVFNPLPEGC
jgi:hypothetical protein